MSIDFRECLYALSDVIVNRPPPLRQFDQIYMKLPDMLLQAELASRWFDGKRVVFIGDGDAIALSLVHLANQKLLPGKPASVVVLDFDERVINSINTFASTYQLRDIRAELYNVADPLPGPHWQKYDAFYTNPPWGASNEGRSVEAFIRRGMECVIGDAIGCLVIGDHPDYPWTQVVQMRTQKLFLERQFRIVEMIPRFHKYHLDSEKDLTSCAMIVQRSGNNILGYDSKPLTQEDLCAFYGSENPLRFHYIRDLLKGGKFGSRDIEVVPFDGASNV